MIIVDVEELAKYKNDEELFAKNPVLYAELAQAVTQATATLGEVAAETNHEISKLGPMLTVVKLSTHLVHSTDNDPDTLAAHLATAIMLLRDKLEAERS